MQTISTFVSMGCSAKCILYGTSEDQNRRMQQDLLDLLQRIEKVASFYDPDAEANRLQRGVWVPVSSELLEMLTLSKSLHEETHGAFDVSLGRLKALWDATRRSHVMPSRAEIDRALEASGMEKVEVRPPSIRIRDVSLKLDLSAVAKGYAIDKGVSLLKSAGAQGGMINIGGDIGVFGIRGATGCKEWEIGIQDPRPGKRVLGRVTLQDSAIATSGDYERFATVGDGRIGHIFKAGRGPFQPSGPVLSVTIVNSSCAEADALATAVFAMGRKQGVAYLERKPSVAGYLVVSEENGILICDKKMRILDFVLAE